MRITKSQLKEIIKEELVEVRTFDPRTDKMGGVGTVAGATIGGLLGSLFFGFGAAPGAAAGAMAGGWIGGMPASKQQTKILAKLSKQIATEESLMAALHLLPASQDPNQVVDWLEERLKESELSEKEKKMLRFDESALRAASPFGEDSPATDNIISILARYEILDPNSMSVKMRKAWEKMNPLGHLKKLGDDEAWFSENTAMKVTRARLKELIKEELEAVLNEKERTAKGNITQATREKHATVGKDKFPIFDKKSAEAAIDLRGHAPEADRAKIINKAAKYAPEAAKKAREADKAES